MQYQMHLVSQYKAFARTKRKTIVSAEFLGKSSVTYAVKKYVLPLVEQGLIVMSNPKAPASRTLRLVRK